MQRPTVPINTFIIQNLPKAQKTLRKRAERFLRGLGISCMTVSSKKQITDTGRLWKEGDLGSTVDTVGNECHQDTLYIILKGIIKYCIIQIT